MTQLDGNPTYLDLNKIIQLQLYIFLIEIFYKIRCKIYSIEEYYIYSPQYNSELLQFYPQ